MTTHADVPVSTDFDEVVLLGLRLAMPAGSSLRLDQPCAYEHGSVGGWRRDNDGEVAYTLLWRPPAYWSRTPDEGADVASLQDEFVDQALAATRKDSRAMDVEERQPTEVAGHAGELVDTTIAVRRKAGRVSLRRRQALWTCPESGRHIAFEVSTLTGEAERVPALFDAMLTTVSCHPDSGS